MVQAKPNYISSLEDQQLLHELDRENKSHRCPILALLFPALQYQPQNCSACGLQGRIMGKTADTVSVRSDGNADPTHYWLCESGQVN